MMWLARDRMRGWIIAVVVAISFTTALTVIWYSAHRGQPKGSVVSRLVNNA